MADDIRDDADNESTRIVRRPGPAKLPVNIAASVRADAVSPTPAAASAAVIAPTPAAPANLRGEPGDGAPAVVPPVASDRPIPVMTPPAPRPQAIAQPSPASDANLSGGGAVAASPPPAAAVWSGQSIPGVVRPGPASLPLVVPLPQATAAKAERAGQLSAESKLPEQIVAHPAHDAAIPSSATPASSSTPLGTPAVPLPAFDPVVGWLVIVKGPGRGTAHEITTGRNSIGSAPSQAIRLDFGDPAIASTGHAYIVYDDEAREFLVEDGKQKVVVRLNGRLLTETMPIGNGDELRIGATTVRFVALCGPDFDWGATEKADVATPVESSAEVVIVVSEG